MKRYSVLLLCLLLCLAACTKIAPAPQPTDAPTAETTQAPAVSTDAPAETGDLSFSGTTLNGDPIDAAVIRDYDLVIVNCWAEWCGPCVEELPALERIHQEYPNVLILGVLVATYSQEQAKQALADAGVTYPTLEPVGTLSEIGERSMYIPATYFFDRNGNEIGEPIVGGQSYDEWKATVDKLLG